MLRGGVVLRHRSPVRVPASLSGALRSRAVGPPPGSTSGPHADPAPLLTAVPFDLLRPCRTIAGWSAVLLPFRDDGAVDWPGFERLLTDTSTAGLVPAVNMDTGFGNLIDAATRAEVLARASAMAAGGPFAAGVFVADAPGDPFDLVSYASQMATVAAAGGTPVVVQSYGLTSLPPGALLTAYADLGESAGPFVAFELGTMFAPFGAIYELETWAGLLEIPTCIGAKHSSLQRAPEWDRLRVRDDRRPEFKVFTGNDLAIDMVMFGSDYLLGLSALAPDLFAARDRAWAAGDPWFHDANDVLQAIGAFAFRPPVPAYRHSVAQFLQLRGRLDASAIHPASPRRPDADLEVLGHWVARVDDLVAGAPR
jgi:dihydrodipicolinate synthase/N-acetylneuraminate lyase